MRYDVCLRTMIGDEDDARIVIDTVVFHVLKPIRQSHYRSDIYGIHNCTRIFPIAEFRNSENGTVIRRLQH